MSNLKKNLGYQTAYQIFATCLPLITSPYLSRVLGADGLGTYSYSFSIVSYFTLFALLGVANYGMRSIAQSEKDKHSISKTFWGIYLFQIFSSFLSILVYAIVIQVAFKDDLVIYIYQGILIFSSLLDISWLYFGLEKFKITVIRSALVKIITFISIFVFIRDPNDVEKYIFIMALGTLIGNLCLWMQIRKFICFEKITIADIRKHIGPNLVLFVPVLAATVYHVMDKTMLGMFTTRNESGYYYNADKVANIPLTIINGCCTVFMSNISVLVKQKANTLQETQKKSIEICMLAVSIMAFGIASVSRVFCPVFFGDGYDACIELIYYFSIIMVMKTISNITRSAYLIPYGYDKLYIVSIVIGAGINLICNYIFIVSLAMGALGATIGTLVAETSVAVVQIIMYMKKQDRTIIKSFLSCWPYFFMGTTMLLMLLLLDRIIVDGFLGLILRVGIGGVVYGAIFVAYCRITNKPIMSLINFRK